jgi:NTP pyrophosphatase (non-canonical NTP hydrolase)
MDIKELQRKVIAFRNERDWAQYHNPKDLAISLSLEAAELLEIFQWKSGEEVEAIRQNESDRQRVKEELGDIFIYALNLSDAFGFDPAEVISEKLEINEKKYPKDRVKGRAEKYNEYK